MTPRPAEDPPTFPSPTSPPPASLSPVSLSPTTWPLWRLLRITRPGRRLLHRFVLGPVVRRCARPLRVEGLEHVPDAPVVFAANHGSHADTAVLLHVLGPRLGGRLVPAAAADYFFASRTLGVLSTVVVGALPFPREGRTGLRRCRAVLRAGHSVLLFPQGTRDGGPFRPGVGHLAAGGAPVVPVHLDGTALLLPKGAVRPVPGPVTVTFGAPLDLTGVAPRVATARVASAVHALAPASPTVGTASPEEAA